MTINNYNSGSPRSLTRVKVLGDAIKFSAAAIVESFSYHPEREIFMMPDSNSLLKMPNVFLTLGVISISAATFFAYTGKVWARFRGWVYRDKEPRVFWGEVAAYFLVGAFFVGYFLSKI